MFPIGFPLGGRCPPQKKTPHLSASSGTLPSALDFQPRKPSDKSRSSAGTLCLRIEDLGASGETSIETSRWKLGSVGYFTPMNPLFISRWNNTLILTMDPNFHLDIQVGETSFP